MKQLPQEVQNLINSEQLIPNIKSIFKELIENSIDAGSSKIQIDLFSSKIRNKSSTSLISKIVVKDNGKGIPYEFFPTLCKRHYTSKITDYQDLQNCATFGFRGEALHGISFMSMLSIVSNHNNDYGICFDFLNGELLGDYEDPKVVEREQGTSIILEDIFKGNEIKKTAYLKVVKVVKAVESLVRSFAVHFVDLEFMAKLNGKEVVHVLAKNNKNSKLQEIYPELKKKKLMTVTSSENSNADYYIESIFSEPNAYKSKKKIVIFYKN
jgi:DNA mismatch repair protein MutL